MKDGVHVDNMTQPDELTAARLLRQMLERRKKNKDDKVHIYEIENNNLGKEIAKL